MKIEFTPDENKRIKGTKSSFFLAKFGFYLSALLFIITIISSIFYPEIFPQKQNFILTPLLLFWLYLLRLAPSQWKQFNRDVKNISIKTIRGTALLHSKPGFRILFSPKSQLTVDGLTFDLNNYPPKQLFIGRNVECRYLKQSRLLLSIIDLKTTEQNSALTIETTLTKREYNILVLMSEGKPDKLIARELNLEPATIRTYNSSLYKKLNATNRKDAVINAKLRSLIDVN